MATSHSSARVTPLPLIKTVVAPITLNKRVQVLPRTRTTPLRFGAASLAGEVDLITTPISNRIVRAYDRASGVLLRQAVTDSAGLYSFNDLDSRFTYYVVALDLQPGGYNAAIADYVTPT